MRLHYLGGLLPKNDTSPTIVLLARNEPIVIENRVGYSFEVPDVIGAAILRDYNVDSVIFTEDERAAAAYNAEPRDEIRYTREQLQEMLARLDAEEQARPKRAKKSEEVRVEIAEEVSEQ